MKKIKAVIFDLDGTLLDTLEDLADSCNYGLKNNNLPERTLGEIRNFVGNGYANLISLCVPDGKQNPLYEKVYKESKEYYSKNCQVKTCLYNGIKETLTELKNAGIQIGIVSNKPNAQVKALHGIYFKEFVELENCLGENEAAGIKRKPAPDSVLEVLKHFGTTKEETLYVGDSDVDFNTAKNAGLKCISCEWGFKTREFLQNLGAQNIISQPQQLLEYL